VGELYQTYDDIEVALVPGMGSRRGQPAGARQGVYDHLLAAMPHTYKIGVCFDFQKVTHVPTAEWDIKMDEVIA
jgi:5-formyltetrahydrofolate cyclo-ligase